MEARGLLSTIFPLEIVEEIESYVIPDLQKAASQTRHQAVVDSEFDVLYYGSNFSPFRYNSKRFTNSRGVTTTINYRPCHSCGDFISRRIVNHKQQETHWMCPYWTKLKTTRFKKSGWKLQVFSDGKIAIATKPNPRGLYQNKRPDEIDQATKDAVQELFDLSK